MLDRTAWEFPEDAIDPRFLVIAHPRSEAGEHAPAVPPADFAALPRERLIVHGEPLTPHEATPAGVVCALGAPTREAVSALLKGGQAGVGEGFDVEILDWELGGRH